MEEKELQELEMALRAAAPNLPWESLPEWHPYDRLKIAAVNAIPSLLSDLREARRLLGQTHRDYCRATCPGSWDKKMWVPSVHEAICQDVAAFLGNAAAQPTPTSPSDPVELAFPDPEGP